MDQLRLFVSHTNTDKPFADTLVHALRGAGADVWYDEHNLGTGQLLDEITRELAARPVFVVVLSKEAFTSTWVKQECRWAYNLYNREPGRVILPVLAGPIAPGDFNALLYLEDFKRVEAPGYKPYPAPEAIERTLRALTLAPDGAASALTQPEGGETADQLITEGKALMGKKQYIEAIPFLERATRLAPQNAAAWGNLGWSYNEAKRRGEDVAAYERALALAPTVTWVWNNKGNALRGLKRYEEALAAYERAIALDSGLAQAWNGKGSALRGLKRYEEALAAYEHAIALDSGLANAWNGKGAVHYDLQRYEEALAAFERAIALDSGYALAWNGKGSALRDLQRNEEALAAFERAIALDSGLAQAWNGKGSALRGLKRYEEALAAFEHAIALDSGYALAWNSKGAVHYDLKRYEEALAAFERAITLDPTVPTYSTNRANALKALGRS